MGTAAELWEFADPQSEVSKRLEASIKAVLSHGTRITFVGSIDDQLVPLEVRLPSSLQSFFCRMLTVGI
jgi:UDP-2,3-diacylglucosamine pyrophosphatase LpxH